MATSWTPGLGGGNPIRYVFVTELRTAINALRAANGLPAYSWTNPGLAAGDPIRAIYFSELRTALNDVFVAKSSLCPMFTKGLPLPGTPISAQHLLDLRDWVNKLEDGIDPRFGVAGGLSETEFDLFKKAGTSSRALTWYHDWTYSQSTPGGMGRTHLVGKRYDTDSQGEGGFWNGGHGSSFSRFITNYCRQNDELHAELGHLSLADGLWYRVGNEDNQPWQDGANDNATTDGTKTRHGNAFPSYINGQWVSTGGPEQGRPGECFHVYPSQYARWFWQYFDAIRAGHPNSPVGLASLIDAGYTRKGKFINNNSANLSEEDPAVPYYTWIDDMLYALDAITSAGGGPHLPQVLNENNFFWALHFYATESQFDLINGVYHLQDSAVTWWSNRIRDFIDHVRGLQFPPGSANSLSSSIPTIIPEFGSLFRPTDSPDPVARQEAMTKLVNGVGAGTGLKGIEASYKVVAWFWFISGWVPQWANMALVKDGALTPLGDTYKALAGG